MLSPYAVPLLGEQTKTELARARAVASDVTTDPAERIAMVRLLSEARDLESVEPLLAVLQASVGHDGALAVDTIYALASIGGRKAAAELTRLFLSRDYDMGEEIALAVSVLDEIALR